MTTKSGEYVEWNDTKKSICAAGVAIGLAHLHANNIIHRYMTSSNILLDENMYPKIGGLGVSRFLPEGSDGINDIWEMVMDKRPPLCMAPEMFDESFGGYNLKVDVYAYGMFLYELATGAKPFKEKGELVRFNLRRYVVEGLRPTIPDYVSPMWADIIRQCWDEKPEKRPTMQEIVDRILAESEDFVLECCDVDEFEDYIEMVKLK